MSASLRWCLCTLIICGIITSAAIFDLSSSRLAAVAAGQSPTTAQNPPTFRSGVRLIEVDVFVTDR